MNFYFQKWRIKIIFTEKDIISHHFSQTFIIYNLIIFLDKEGHCPLRNSVSKCTPKCVSDFQCSFNEKCCPNKCGSESCVSASPVSTGNGYKGSSNGKRVYIIF